MTNELLITILKGAAWKKALLYLLYPQIKCSYYPPLNKLIDLLKHQSLFVYSFTTAMDVKPVTMIVTRTHVAVTRENHQWPLPRYLDVPTPKEPQFHCIEKYKMTDISGLVRRLQIVLIPNNFLVFCFCLYVYLLVGWLVGLYVYLLVVCLLVYLLVGGSWCMAWRVVWWLGW